MGEASGHGLPDSWSRGDPGRAGLADWTGGRPPDRPGVLRDRPVAREFPGTGDVEDGLAAPFLAVRVEVGHARLRRDVGPQVSQMHVVVAVREQGIPDRAVEPRLAGVEVAREDQIQGLAGLVLAVVVP